MAADWTVLEEWNVATSEDLFLCWEELMEAHLFKLCGKLPLQQNKMQW